MADTWRFEREAALEPEIHVLAVDDNLIDRMMIKKLLLNLACRVTTVESGQRALEILETFEPVSMEEIKFNLIITDYCMPDMTGFDLLKRIKATCSLKDIPVIVMSSENVPNRINRCLEEGAEDFFLKPLQPSDMQRLREHVRSCTNIPGHAFMSSI
ncbi:hypothetical protein KP509_09G076500 [Ceratopteris richardii]|uniref:Response regulatory domain-containing protein n=1 Tax=Ceratopteris richardii TaxID=49495 RepID=A0A8T2U5M5_CERRI|nr:hypothetical protein KP509_09G076500 [Ceratopteris richardii]